MMDAYKILFGTFMKEALIFHACWFFQEGSNLKSIKKKEAMIYYNVTGFPKEALILSSKGGTDDY